MLHMRKRVRADYAGASGAGAKGGAEETLSTSYMSNKSLILFTSYSIIGEGSLEVKLPTIWTDEKQSRRAEAERREIRREKSRRGKSKKKEDGDARKGRSRDSLCFSNDLWLRRVEK